jgi:hypothetical protein
MTIRRRLTRWIASKLNVPAAAIEMFETAHDFSGLDTSTLPSELIPLNTVMLSRGLLNFAILQAVPGWVLPYWARRQYDPADAAFLPRSHGGISINLTNRNWTALGEPGQPVESIVDPRGLVTPFPGGWSVDTWFSVDGVAVYPSAVDPAEQSLLDGAPIVETEFAVHGCRLALRTYQFDGTLHHRARLFNEGHAPRRCRIGFAVRPFNTEGVSLVHAIEFDPALPGFIIDSRTGPVFAAPPAGWSLSSHDGGDVADRWTGIGSDPVVRRIACASGLATACAWYAFDLPPGGGRDAAFAVPIGTGAVLPPPAVELVRRRWDEHHARGATLRTPVDRLNRLVRSSLSTLLMLADTDEVTPGPATYHQFWFRDAAYMIHALDTWGHHRLTAPMIRAFPERQEKSGMYRSQMGEWDSTGQALWTAAQHAVLSGSDGIPDQIVDSLLRGVEWIRRSRVTDRGSHRDGLLPEGLSAEHLGHVDQYYWDNAWSVAGLDAFLAVMNEKLSARERDEIAALTADFRSALSLSVAAAERRAGHRGIPAGPGRGIDAGMIGNLCMLYPLRLVPPDDGGVGATLRTLMDRFFVDGMFFQPFIHSGLNTYLTLQAAHALLWIGDRLGFWRTFMAVVDRASPTYTYPEAIHPGTGGGVMGDGHHGWTAAEIVLAVRDALVFEARPLGANGQKLVVLGGVPADWFAPGRSTALERCPVQGGTASIGVEARPDLIALDLQVSGDGGASPAWEVRLPLAVQRAILDGGVEIRAEWTGRETRFDLPPGSHAVRVYPAGGAR